MNNELKVNEWTDKQSGEQIDEGHVVGIKLADEGHQSAQLRELGGTGLVGDPVAVHRRMVLHVIDVRSERRFASGLVDFASVQPVRQPTQPQSVSSVEGLNSRFWPDDYF